MAYYGSIEITDASGWKKGFALEKPRLSVGSAPFNDLVLSEEHGGGVATAHLQLFYSPDEPTRLRVVNLDRQPVRIQKPNQAGSALGDAEETIAGNSSGRVENGGCLVVGNFQLAVSLSVSSGFIRSARSQSLGLALELPDKCLRPGGRLEGRVLVSNFGSQPRCQINVDLDGLPAECYKIEPVPLLYSGGQEYLRISIRHAGSRPLAGACQVMLRADAPRDYPTEVVVINEVLEIMPCFGFQLKVSGVEPEPVLSPAPAPLSPPAPVKAIPTTQTETPPEPFPPLPLSVATGEGPGVREESAPAPTPIPPIEPAPAPPEEPFISVLAVEEPAAPAQDWSLSAWQGQNAAPLRPPARLGSPRLPNRLAGQNVTVLKAGQQDEKLEEPPLPFDEEEAQGEQ